VLSSLPDEAKEPAQKILAGLGKEYVLISEEKAAQLLPFLQWYRKKLVSEIDHEDWVRETEIEEGSGMDSVQAKWGAGRGWKLYCVTDLIEACKISAVEHQPICVSFS